MKTLCSLSAVAARMSSATSRMLATRPHGEHRFTCPVKRRRSQAQPGRGLEGTRIPLVLRSKRERLAQRFAWGVTECKKGETGRFRIGSDLLVRTMGPSVIPTTVSQTARKQVKLGLVESLREDAGSNGTSFAWRRFSLCVRSVGD